MPTTKNRKQVRVGPGTLWIAAVGATEPANIQATFPGVAGGVWTEGPYTNEGTTFTIAPSFEDVEVAEEYDPLLVEKTGQDMTVALAIAQHGVDFLQLALNGGVITSQNSPRNVAVTTTSGSAAITSAGLFDTTYDVGASISGTGIPAGATLIAVASASAATMSANATASGSPTASITRLIGDRKYEPPSTSATPVGIAIGWDSRDRKERYVWRNCIQTGDVETSRQRAPQKALIPLSMRLLLPLAAGVQPFAYWEADPT